MGFTPKITPSSPLKPLNKSYYGVIDVSLCISYVGRMIHLPAITERGISVVFGLPESKSLLEMIARLALLQPVRVIVGGNHFDAHQLARIIRRHTVHLDPTLERIQQARPFTCHQAVKLLAETQPTMPLVVIDMLTTFYDENISDSESFRLTNITIGHLQRLGRQAPVLVSLRPSPMPARVGLVKMVQDVADKLYIFQTPEETFQPSLFGSN